MSAELCYDFPLVDSTVEPSTNRLSRHFYGGKTSFARTSDVSTRGSPKYNLTIVDGLADTNNEPWHSWADADSIQSSPANWQTYFSCFGDFREPKTQIDPRLFTGLTGVPFYISTSHYWPHLAKVSLQQPQSKLEQQRQQIFVFAGKFLFDFVLTQSLHKLWNLLRAALVFPSRVGGTADNSIAIEFSHQKFKALIDMYPSGETVVLIERDGKDHVYEFDHSQVDEMVTLLSDARL